MATAEYYAAHAAEFLADEPVVVEGVRAWIGYDPMEVVFAVMPWNLPFWQVLRFAVASAYQPTGLLLARACRCPETSEVSR